MNQIDLIRVEIERQREEIHPTDTGEMKVVGTPTQLEQGWLNALSWMEKVLDTIQEQSVCEELEEEYKDYVESDPVYSKLVNGIVGLSIARHFAQWGAEHAKIDVTDFCKPIDPGIAQCVADHFWEMLGEDEKPVPKDLESYAQKVEDYYDVGEERGYLCVHRGGVKEAVIAGAKWQKEQMLKEAVEGKVFMSFAPGCNQRVVSTQDVDLPCETKVKLIIVKEDEK